jgi:hypothetical protein
MVERRSDLSPTRREFLRTAAALASGCFPFLPEDVDLSGRVDHRDVVAVRNLYRQGLYDPAYDVNRDGVVDRSDIDQVRSRRGQRVLRYAAHYYPWWDNHLFPPFHWPAGVSYEPLRGRYNTRDPQLVAGQIESACAHGLDIFLIEWVGPPEALWIDSPDRTLDLALREALLPALEWAAGPARFAITYDSAVVFGNAFGSRPDHFDFNLGPLRERFLADFAYLRANYFDHPRYLRIDDRPLVYLYLSRSFRGDFRSALDLVHAAGPLFLLGDEIFPSGPVDRDRIAALDAVTAYHVYIPSALEPFGFRYSAYTDQVEAEFRRWHDLIGGIHNVYSGQPVRMVPTVIPDFNDSGLRRRSGRERNRPLVFGPDPAQEFQQQIERLKPLVDRRLNLMALTSYNEFHEGTTVEEALEYGTGRLEALRAQKAFVA